jgi:hypothetical protein
MTLRAIGGEASGLMVGVAGRGVRGKMTAHTITGPVDEGELSRWRRPVTLIAVQRDMRAGEREARLLMRAHHR